MSSDNTRVVIKRPILSEPIKFKPREQDQLYDADKVKYYQNLQDFYNTNFFGNGVFGTQTRFNPATDREQIQSNFNYAKDNAINFGMSIIPTAMTAYFKGVLPLVSKRAVIGDLSAITPFKIGQGAEAIVINNSPFTVGKITAKRSGELLEKNLIPNYEPLKFVGYLKDGVKRFPTFVQKKVKILTDETFPKYIKKLDKAMQEKGFKVVNDPDVQYRAYTNGKYVIDDVSPNNVGINMFGEPKMIDFNIQTIPEWLEQGFSL